MISIAKHPWSMPGVPSDAAITDALGELALSLTRAGCELILLEMMYHPGRARLALEAALATKLPVWFGLSAGKRGRSCDQLRAER